MSGPHDAVDSATPAREQVQTAQPGTVGLDEKVLAASAASTAAVASLLGDIFAEPATDTDADRGDAAAETTSMVSTWRTDNCWRRCFTGSLDACRVRASPPAAPGSCLQGLGTP